MQPYAPLGTLYAASALRGQGFSVAVFDPMLEAPEGIRRALETHKPKICAVYEDDFNFLSKMCLARMREVAWEIAAAAKSVGAVTIVHGSDATDNSELFLENGFDYVLCGEAEKALTNLCSAIVRGTVCDFNGLVTRASAGQLDHHGQRLARNPEWSTLGPPSRDLIDFDLYRAAWTKAHGFFSANMVSSRGCPFHCNWCAKPISGDRFQLRPAASVAEEMRWLKREAKADHIWFGDDVFALDHRWVEEFAAEVVRQDAGLPFKIQSRADLMTERVVSDLKTAGCAEVWMGVESGSQVILDAMEKGLKTEAVVSARQRLKEAGIRACYFLQFGYPGENWERLQETIAFVRATRPNDVGISFSYPLPGTPFYERVREQLGQKRNWRDSDDLCIMFKGAYTTEFYRAVRDALHAEVCSWSMSIMQASTQKELRRLWRIVEQLEPTSRQPDAFRAILGIPRSQPTGIVPLHALTAIGEA